MQFFMKTPASIDVVKMCHLDWSLSLEHLRKVINMGFFSLAISRAATPHSIGFLIDLPKWVGQ
jgi:hypothetical protein